MTNAFGEIRDLCDRITPGPWEVLGGDEHPPCVVQDVPEDADCGVICEYGTPDDLAFIARARTLVPALVDLLERRESVLSRLRARRDAHEEDCQHRRSPRLPCTCCLSDTEESITG